MTYLEKLQIEIECAGYTFAKDAGAWQCFDDKDRTLVASAIRLGDCIEKAARSLGCNTRP